MAQKVRPSKWTVAIVAALQEYDQEVTDQIKEDVRAVAKQCVKDIKAKAPVKTGEYRRGWKSRVAYESTNDIRIEVYNSTRPSLAHLLEFGHALHQGGRTSPHPHIYPAEQAAAKSLESKAKVAVKG